MHTGPLQKLAVALTSRAACIAASLIVREACIPEGLRGRIGLALAAGAQTCGDLGRVAPDDPDAAAAREFVAACCEVSKRLRPGR